VASIARTVHVRIEDDMRWHVPLPGWPIERLQPCRTRCGREGLVAASSEQKRTAPRAGIFFPAEYDVYCAECARRA
jgi:hypothetical protein